MCIFPCTLAVYCSAVDWPSWPNIWPRGKSPSITGPAAVSSLLADKLPAHSPHTISWRSFICYKLYPGPLRTKLVTNREIFVTNVVGRFVGLKRISTDVLGSDTWIITISSEWTSGVRFPTSALIGLELFNEAFQLYDRMTEAQGRWHDLVCFWGG